MWFGSLIQELSIQRDLLKLPFHRPLQLKRVLLLHLLEVILMLALNQRITLFVSLHNLLNFGLDGEAFVVDGSIAD